MRNERNAWREFSRPVGLTLSWLLSISFVIFVGWGLVSLAGDSSDQHAWDRACALAGGAKTSRGSLTFCVTSVKIPGYPAWDWGEWQQGCYDLGGDVFDRGEYYHRDTYNVSYVCARSTEIEGIGPRP